MSTDEWGRNQGLHTRNRPHAVQRVHQQGRALHMAVAIFVFEALLCEDRYRDSAVHHWASYM